MYCGQITVKNGPNLPISNSKADLHNINAHVKFGENSLKFTYLYFKLLSLKLNRDVLWTDNSVKTGQNLAISNPNLQIFTI